MIGLFMPLSFMLQLQLQIRMKLTVLRLLLLKRILLLIQITVLIIRIMRKTQVFKQNRPRGPGGLGWIVGVRKIGATEARVAPDF